jgi:putative membrane protein
LAEGGVGSQSPETPASPEPDARFTLANERTLLAYQRTSIGLLAAAIAVGHFFGDGGLVLVFAGALLATGAVAAIGGYQHFREVDRAIRDGTRVPAGPAAHVLSIAMVGCLVLAAIYVFVPGAR